MKIYIKELGKEEDNIQILDTSTDRFFMPRVGDSILVFYTVIKVEWISFKSGNEIAVIWVQKKKDSLVAISIIEKRKDGIWKTREEKLMETFIERAQLSETLIPRVGERIEMEGKTYKVLTVTKEGGLLNFSKLKVTVYEIIP